MSNQNSESQAMTVHPSTSMAMVPMEVNEVIHQAAVIQKVLETVMQRDQHYGVIPGTGDKPSLLKPGAEKIAETFRLAPRYHLEVADMGRGHRDYAIRCELFYIPTGNFVGEGVGSCSTMESKYRYRDASEPTGQPVPRDYWKERDQSLIGGKGFRAKKIDGEWQIVRVTERQENPDIADVYNTVLKMAKKRALVDAVLTATAASDIFTQDVEDMADNGGARPETAPAPQQQRPAAQRAPAQRPSAQQARPQQQAAPQQRQGLSLDENRTAFRKAAHTSLGYGGDEDRLVGDLIMLGYGSVEDIPEDKLREVLDALTKQRDAARA